LVEVTVDNGIIWQTILLTGAYDYSLLNIFSGGTLVVCLQQHIPVFTIYHAILDEANKINSKKWQINYSTQVKQKSKHLPKVEI